MSVINFYTNGRMSSPLLLLLVSCFTYTAVKAAKTDVFVATWNVNGKAPTALNLRKLLLNSYYENGWDTITQPKIVVIGIQEMVELSFMGYIWTTFGTSKTQAIVDWKNELDTILTQKTYDYQYVESHQMFGIGLFIYVKRGVFRPIKNIITNEVKCGIGPFGTKIGNKGSVATLMQINSTKFCFYSCHLAAQFADFRDRNRDISDILAQMFGPRQCDRTVVFGDLNYRFIDDPKIINEIKEYPSQICQGNVMKFPTTEQLKTERKPGGAWVNFHEEKVTFMPTFKLNPKAGDFEMGVKNKRKWPNEINANPNTCFTLRRQIEMIRSETVSKDQRMPAWCDRILWKKSAMDEEIKMKRIDMKTSYISPPLTGSDHAPVCILLEIQYDSR